MNANIVIMGQSGNGKSTIVNAIMRKEVAPTGKGTAVTTKNQIYSTSYRLGNDFWSLNLYDTVGIELSDKITQATLIDIEEHLRKSQMQSSTFDVNVVWFCINNRSSRFQDYEIDLIRKLSYEYEIPFVIVMTQCLDNQIGELEKSIQTEMPEVVTARILAKDYQLRGGTIIPAYGLNDLLRRSLTEYNKMKVRVLESKLNDLQQKLEVSEWYIKNYEDKAKACIEDYVDRAGKIGWLPGGCIPFVHGLCIKMVAELHGLYGLSSSEDFAANIFSHIIVGLLATPFMVVPILSSAVARGYVEAAGEQYAEALSNAVKHSKYSELSNQKIMTERIRKQLNLRKGR
ncbi:GTPase domain-containing protein [Ruminococcus flavefaciens]|uniref:GTPase domain-containing protein n=1 Tax=Ruminococcus flavefaciens TaxID=1265 RepID=UPI000491529C|nr:GTPase domain-containing protein [Ruminococcus flavefaciens]